MTSPTDRVKGVAKMRSTITLALVFWERDEDIAAGGLDFFFSAESEGEFEDLTGRVSSCMIASSLEPSKT